MSNVARITNSMWQHLEQIIKQLSHDPQIRAIVMSGRGPKAFTAGLDVCTWGYTLIRTQKGLIAVDIG